MELAVEQTSAVSCKSSLTARNEERRVYSVITSFLMFDIMLGRHVCFAPTEAVILSFKSSVANENDQSAL